MTVWLSTLRKDITMHLPTDTDRTRCTRWYGRVTDEQPERGWLMSEEHAVAEYRARRCPQCFKTLVGVPA